MADYGQWGADDDMTPQQHYLLHVINWRVEGIISMRDPIVVPVSALGPALSTPNLLARAVLASGLTPEQIEEIKAAAAALGDIPTIDEIAAVVDRELDEQSLGGADQD